MAIYTSAIIALLFLHCINGAVSISAVTPAPPSNAPTELCPKGLAYKSDCNNCFCNPNTGQAGCTMRACPSGPPLILFYNSTPKPTPAPLQPAAFPPPPPAPGRAVRSGSSKGSPVADLDDNLKFQEMEI